MIAASLVLVVILAGVIGVRGFESAELDAKKQSVVLDRVGDREAGATGKRAAAVMGSAKKPARTARSSRPAKRRTVRRAKRRTATRGGLAAPTSPRTARTPPAVAPSAPAPEPPAADEATDKEAPAAAAPATPVEDIVEEVTDATRKPVESVGDVLLDVRDLLP